MSGLLEETKNKLKKKNISLGSVSRVNKEIIYELKIYFNQAAHTNVITNELLRSIPHIIKQELKILSIDKISIRKKKIKDISIDRTGKIIKL